MTSVLVYHGLPIAKEIEKKVPGAEIIEAQTAEEVRAALPECEILVIYPPYWSASFLEALDTVDWIQTTSAGYAAYPIDAFRDRNIVFANSSNIHDTVVSEHVFGLMFAFSRNVSGILEMQQNREWNHSIGDEMWDWKGKRLTVFGLGNIGESVALRAQAFGMEVVGIKRNPATYCGVLNDHRVRPPSAVEEIFPGTDVLVLTLPLTDETYHIIDESSLAKLPSTAYLINVGRGQLIETSALVDAVRHDALGGVALDVTDPEPLPQSSPLWAMDDVLISPHVGARTTEFARRFADLFAFNFERWKAGEPLDNQIV